MADDSELPPVVDVVLELGIKRINAPIREAGSPAFYPRMMLWVHQGSGMILKHDLLEPEADYLEAVVGSLDDVVAMVRGLPREIRLRDVKLAAELKGVLEKAGVSVVVREDLPELDEALEGMADMGMGGNKRRASLLDVPGMKLDHLHAFAEAAKSFFGARPWRHLDDSDLIRIEEPAGPKGSQFTMVLGAGGETFGLGFVATRQAHDALQERGTLPKGGVWSLQFGELDHLPFEDGEVWEENNLPAAAVDAYPFFIKFLRSKPPVHPTPDELAWAEGLLRAIAATTENQMDTGRWEKTVKTAKGQATYRLSLPILLEQMAGKKTGGGNEIEAMRGRLEMMMRGVARQIEENGIEGMEGSIQSVDAADFTPKTDADRAQMLVYEARQSSGRRVIQLARQALAIDPDCADALVVLAEREPEAKEAVELLRRAEEAGRRRLGEDFFKENAGDFWGILETRPYMRARAELARLLTGMGCVEEAAGHYRELLRLNPNDSQGNRYLLAHALLRMNQLDELDYLLNRMYADDVYAEWAFTRALLEFRRHGDSEASRKRLAQATAQNRHVVPMLVGKEELPEQLPETYRPGGEDEAALTIHGIGAAWIRTPGAIEWLENSLPKPPGKPGRGKGKKGPAKGGREPEQGGPGLF